MDYRPVKPHGIGNFYNWHIRAHEEIFERGRLIDSPDIIIEQGTRGKSLHLRKTIAGGGGQSTGRIEMVKITGIKPDYVAGQLWNDVTWGDSVLVCKPPHLQNSLLHETIDGYLINYTYDAVPDSTVDRIAHNIALGNEYQVIVPRLVIGDILYTGSIKLGAGIVWHTNASHILGPDDKPIERMDLNVDGRAWAKQYAA